jgi:peptidoglycan/LPS O-acetylase OafA/YrhL
MSSSAVEQEPQAGGGVERGRVAGLDGLRGLAAFYVVVHHCWLLTWHGYPKNNGPAYLGWLVYGHLAVVVFITLSGFSLAISPARRGWRLGGSGRFARRRAWRILPPYWAALVFSLLIAWTITPQPHSTVPGVRSIAVYGLLLQDNVVAPTPNLAFWSIAVEAELYVVFPLLLLLRRRVGPAAVAIAVAAPVVLLGLLVPAATNPDRALFLTPQMAVPFALGMVAAGVVSASERVRRLPWQWLAALALGPLVILMAARGSVWSANHFYWLDMAIGPGFALLLAALATGRPRALEWFLDTRPIRRLGSFSYSLYLVHVPIVVAVTRVKHLPHATPFTAASFFVTAAIAIPTCLVVAWIFASIFEIPFQRHRGATALRAAVSARIARFRPSGRPDPAPPEPVVAASRPAAEYGTTD